MLRGVIDDLRVAVRYHRAAPAVTIAAVLTLTLGIGATTAIFSLANGLALKPLPVKNPGDLVTITSDTALRYGFHAGAGWSYTMWDALRQRAGSFDGAFAWTLQRLDLSGGGEMQPVNGLVTSGDFFRTLGVEAAIGRTFTPADDVRGGGPDGAVAVISHRMWQRRFGGAPDVVGSRLPIERVPVTIVGVTPQWFRGVDVGQPFDVAIPFSTEALVRGPRSLMNSDGTLLLTVMLRLKSGQSISEATAALRAIQPEIVGPGAPPFLKEPFIGIDGSRGISDRSRLRQQYLYPVLVLSIVSAIVLVIECLNIANLLLSRASARRHELSIRLALGASRGRLIRQHLVEALTLGCVGAAGGMLFATWASRALLTQLPYTSGPVSSGPIWIDLSIDWRLFAFTVAVAVLAIALCGVVPAYAATRVAPIEALQEKGRGTGGPRKALVSSALVAAQISLSIVLIAAAGLFVGTMNRLVNVPLGFDPKGMFVMSMNTQQHQRVLETVTAVPGVLQAAGSVWTPVGTGAGGLLTDARGRRAQISQTSRPAAFNFVTPGWFQTYRTPVKLGREFDTRDGPGAPRVAVVNEALRRILLPEEQPLGATIHAGPCSDGGCTVVGIVADAVYGQSLRDAAPPTVYMPFAQSAGVRPPQGPFRISVRAADDAADVMTRLAAAVHGADAGATFTFRRLEEDLNAAVARERLLAVLAAFFGAIALLLSGIGVYGVSSYAATRRRVEIGIRLALGGQPHAIVRAMVGRIGLFVFAGAALGVLVALWLGRFVAPLLYGLEPRHLPTLVTSTLILAAVAAVAAWIPAARAARMDPAQVLREV